MTATKFDCSIDGRAFVPQLTGPLINMLPSDVVPTSHIRDKRSVSRGIHNDPQLLRVRPPAPTLNVRQYLLPHKSPR
jgi:hypothetical protein